MRLPSPTAALFVFFCLVLSTTSAFAAAGGLDSTYGTNGIVETHFGGFFEFTDAVLCPNGDLVVAGTIPGPILTRYLSTGAVDTTFGTNGVVTLPTSTFFADSSVSSGGILAVLSNEKILVLTIPEINGNYVLALQRFNSNGTVDSSFGSGGLVVVNVPVVSPYVGNPTLMLAQPDGKMLLGGSSFPSHHSTLPVLTVLGRYLSNGALDTTFGSGGFTSSVSIGTPTTLGLLSGDGILALNDVGQPAQFTPAGALLSTPTSGTVVAITRSLQTHPATFESNGEFLVASQVQGPFGRRNHLETVGRFLASGAPDPSFTSPEISFGTNVPVVSSGVSSLVVDSMGRVVMGGSFATLSGLTIVTSEFALARVEANGALDPTFGSAGTVVSTQLGQQSAIGKLLTQSNGKIIAVGTANTGGGSQDLAIARYLTQ